MSRRLNDDEVDRIRGRAGLQLFTLYLAVLFAIGATIWLGTLILDSARKGDVGVVVMLVLLALVGWTILIGLVGHARGRRRVSTRTAVRRVTGVLTSTRGRYASFKVGGTNVWFADKVRGFALRGAWVAVDVLEDGEVIAIVSSDYDAEVIAARAAQKQAKRRKKRERKRRKRG